MTRSRLPTPADQHGEFFPRRAGYLPSGDLARADERDRRRDQVPAVSITRQFFFHREDLNAGDASYTTRQPVPTAAATYGSVAALGYPVPRAGRIVEGYVWTTDPRTAGTVTLRVRVTENGVSTDYDVDCQINATATQTASGYGDSRVGIPFAAGAIITARLVTVGYAPDTGDFGCLIVAVTEES